MLGQILGAPALIAADAIGPPKQVAADVAAQLVSLYALAIARVDVSLVRVLKEIEDASKGHI